MPSFFSRLQFANVGARNAVISSDQSVDAVVANNLSYLLIRNLSAAMPLPARRHSPHRGLMGICCDASSSLKHIFGILRIRAPAEVGRIDARRVIARVQRKPFLGARISSNSQRNMGCEDRNGFSFRPISKPPITCDVFRAYPVPAIILGGHRDLRPESGFQSIIDWGHRVISHGVSPHVCGQGLALLTQRLRPAFSSRITFCSQGAGGAV